MLTFAMGGLNYPGAVQVMRVIVWEARRQDGSNVALDVTSTQCWQHGPCGNSGERMKIRNEGREEGQVQRRHKKIKFLKDSNSSLCIYNLVK